MTMRMGGAIFKFVAMALVLATVVPARAQVPANPEVPETCRVPRAVFVDDSRLVAATSSLAKSRRLTVVAIGSTSTLGASASAPGAAWPARLESDLRRRLPNAEITVHNRGKARDDAEHMLQRLDADVLALKPDLVIWETGTAEAVRQMEVESFSVHLQAGIERIAKAGADVMLVTPQYSREMARLIAYQPYIDAMNSIGIRRDVLLFPRFEVMRHWVESGQMQLDNLTPAQAAGTADRLYDCIGRQLARVIVRATASAPSR